MYLWVRIKGTDQTDIDLSVEKLLNTKRCFVLK